MLGGAVFVAATWTVAFFLPGLGVVRRWYRDADAIESVVLAMAIGTAGVAFTSFVATALLRTWLTPAWVLGVAAVAIAANARVWRDELRSLGWRRSADAPGPEGDSVNRALAVGRQVVLVVLVPLALFSLRYAREEMALTCVNYASAYVTGIRFGDGSFASFERNEVLRLDTENQEGNTVLIAAFPALYQFLGYRLFYAGNLTIGFGLAYLIGRRLGGSGRYGALLAVLLFFNPLVSSIHDNEENLIAMTMLLASLAMLTRERPSWLAAGAFFALAFGCRHILVPGFAGLALFAATSGAGRCRALARVAVGFAVPCLYFAAHHWLTLGSLLAHESLRHFPQPVPHRFLGHAFEVHTILAWPFTERLLRSPYNPLPSLIQYGTALPVIFGTALTALGLVGAGRLAARSPRLLALLVLLAGPTLAILMVQGNWSETDKIRLFVTPLAPLVVPMVAGAAWLARGSWWVRVVGGALVAALAVALVPLTRAALAVDVAVDPREYVGRPGHAVEVPEDAPFMRRVLVRDAALWPGVSAGGLIEGLFRTLPSFRDIPDELRDRRYEARAAPPGVVLPGLLIPERFDRTQKPLVDWAPPEVPAARDGRVVYAIALDRPLAAEAPGFVSVVDAASVPEDALVLGMDHGLEPVVERGWSASGYPDSLDLIAVRLAVHGDERVMLGLRRRTWVAASPPRPIPGDRLYLRAQEGAHLGILYFANVEPTIQQAWDVDRRPHGALRVSRSAF